MLRVVRALARPIGLKWHALMATALSVVASAVWTWSAITPGENLARLRNSLGAEVGELADFKWEPENPPAGFLTLQGQVPDAFTTIARSVEIRAEDEKSTELVFALEIAGDLMSAPKRVDTPIRDTSFNTYQAIVQQGRGYCADFVKAFGGVALARGVAVRQWGFAFDGFGSGHTFNEVFDRRLRKWVLVDSFHSLYFVDPVSRLPLSTVEVHDRLLGIGPASTPPEIVRISPSSFPFRSDDIALDYYRRGMQQLWLVWGSNQFDYEASFAGRLEEKVHRAIGQFVGIVTGTYPAIRIYPQGLSRRDYQSLVESRNEFLLAVSFLALSIASALLLVGRLLSGRFWKEL